MSPATWYNHTAPLEANFHNTILVIHPFSDVTICPKILINFFRKHDFTLPSPQSCSLCQMTDSIFFPPLSISGLLKTPVCRYTKAIFSVKNMKRISWFTNVETPNHCGRQRVEPAWTVTLDAHHCPRGKKKGPTGDKVL